MRIVIVGAGLGGLSAAICFSKRGHDVLVLEQRKALSQQGGGINVRPGASRIMHSWGLREDLEAIGSVTPTVLLRDLQTGDIVMKNILVDASEHEDWGTARKNLMETLYRKAIESGAGVQFGANVVDIWDDHEKAYLSLGGGDKLDADLILAADGIRSRIRPKILSDFNSSIDPIVSETTFYGTNTPIQAILEKGEVAKRITDQTNINIHMGHGGFVVSRYNPRLNIFGGLFGIKSATDQKGMWDENGDIDYVRRFFAGSCREMTTALELAQTCDRWKLAEMPNLPRWTSQAGRIALLGDSAHAMHPNAAQGFSMIVEDIGVLEYLVSQDKDAIENMRNVTRTWEQIRKPRVERIKEYAKWNTEFFLGEPLAPKGDVKQSDDVKSLKQVDADMNARFHSAKFVKWALDYDAIGEAKAYLHSRRSRL